MMKLSTNIRGFVLSIGLLSMAFPTAFVPAASAQTQETDVALQRGFRTGYSDGYMSGYRDIIDSASKNYTRHAEYGKADRAYSKSYGSMDDYRDGYQQGFESGYDTGFEKRSFESTIPSGLKKRGAIDIGSQVAGVETTTVGATPATTTPAATTPDTTTTATTPAATTPDTTTAAATPDAAYSDSGSQTAGTAITTAPAAYTANGNAIVIIPRDTELILELQEDLSTEVNQEGERFTAKIVSPSEVAGATVEGRIARVLKPGRIKKQSELSLSFDRIMLNDNRWANFNATMMEVLAVKGDNVKRVDNEGTAIGQTSYKQDAIRVGGAAGAGALIGGFAGGPVGVAIGAGIGAAFGVGAVVINRGKHIRLNRNQQLRIKSSYQVQIR